MTKPYSTKIGDVNKPPPGEGWVWHTLELITSPAYRAQTRDCRVLVDFLEVEHMRHGGKENGRLVAPYDQLEQWGIGRSRIKAAFIEAMGLKLVTLEQQGGSKAQTKKSCSKYRLTYFASRADHPLLTEYYYPPSNEWKSVTEDMARRAVEVADEHRQKNRGTRHDFKAAPKIAIPSSHGGTGPVPTGEPDRVPTGELLPTEPRSHVGTAFNILGGGGGEQPLQPAPAALVTTQRSAARSSQLDLERDVATDQRRGSTPVTPPKNRRTR